MQRNVSRLLSASLIVMALAAISPMTMGQAKVEEKTAGPAGRDAHYSISSTSVHLATAHMQGSRFVATVDGVDGPRVDAIVPIIPSFEPGINNATHYILISDDGKHTAYIARKGQDDTLMYDGKALATVHPGNETIHLRFTGPSGAHVAMALKNQTTDLMDLWVDGKAQPSYDQREQPYFSTDGSHWAYLASPDSKHTDKKVLIVDGKDAGYFGQFPQFTADNAHVLTLAQVDKAVAVLEDGKPTVKGEQIRNVIAGPTGSHYAVILSTHQSDGGNVYQVLLDGKLVPNTNYSDHTAKGSEPIVKFSPDGNHLAVICNEQENAISYVVYDGTKGQSYDHIYDNWFALSPDGSWLAYVAKAGPGLFTITNGSESDAMPDSGTFLFSADGKHIIYHGTVDGTTVIYLDGKAVGKMPGSLQSRNELTISRDGSHWVAVNSHGDLILDGKTISGVKLSQSSRTVFSPDGKYLAFNGRVGRTNGMFITDGKKLAQIGPSAGASFITFSPDGKHLFWRQTERVGRAYKIVTYVDGKPTTAMFDNVSNPFTSSPLCWQVDASGVLTCLGPKDGEVKRLVITPDANSSIMPQ